MHCSDTRIGRLRKQMGVEGIDLFYIRDLSNIKWLTAFDDVFDDEPAHALIIAEDEAVLHTDSRYAQACREAAAGSGIAVDDTVRTGAELLADFCERRPRGLFGTGSAPTVGIEGSLLLAEFRRLEEGLSRLKAAPRLVETNAFVLRLRAVKDEGEAGRMRAAQAITDAAFAHIAGFIAPGMTEREIQVELEYYMVRHGASGLAFSSIVACGKNGASPHAIPGEARLERGQAVVLDFGARAQGYCSDMTRTVFLGEPSQRMRDAYGAIRAANEAVQAMLKPGVCGVEAQQLAEDILAEAGFGGTMGHSLGHGVGIDVHEEPSLARRNERPLVAGNVVTVEPGIYIPGSFGMRLEDFGIVTQEGFEVFTKTSHDMVIIERC